MGRGGGRGGHSSGGSHSHSSGSHGSSHRHSSFRGSSSNSFRSNRSSHYGGSRYSRIFSSRAYDGSSYRNLNSIDGIEYGHEYSSLWIHIGHILKSFIKLIVLIAILADAYTILNNKSEITKSTIVRERIDTKNAFVSDCVIDEIGWIYNERKLSSKLKHFYEKTGCQPYIILRKYDPKMTNDYEREKWSQQYYDTHFAENQNVVLYTYFCDEYDEGYGNDTLFVGTESSLVMDAEAQEIFWNYLDYDWYAWDENDNNGMFADVFNKTAERIMTVTTTNKDIANTVLKIVLVVAIGGVLITVLRLTFKRRKEKAQETIDILNAPLDTSSAEDSLIDKYK